MQHCVCGKENAEWKISLPSQDHANDCELYQDGKVSIEQLQHKYVSNIPNLVEFNSGKDKVMTEEVSYFLEQYNELTISPESLLLWSS